MVKKTNTLGPQLIVRSIAFTQAALDALESLAAAVGQHTTRKSSASAVVRALLRNANGDPDIVQKLAGLVEHEQATEISWGKTSRPR